MSKFTILSKPVFRCSMVEVEKVTKNLGYSTGITTSQRKTNEKGVVDGTNTTGFAGGLYPGDLIPFTRKPMFLIVDSNNSWTFKVSWLEYSRKVEWF
jgi:hypothetical protein